MTVPHYVDEGDGRPLVLLHSGGMTSGEWTDHVPRLTRRFRVLAPDLPGHGRTPLDGDRLTVRGMAQAVLAVLDDAGVERAHVVGSSMGGAVALWLGLNARERVDRLVLFRSSYHKDEAGHVHTREVADPELWERIGLADWLSEVHEPQGGPDAWRRVIERVAEAFDPDVTDHAHELDALEELDAPTLLVAGDRDPVVPLDDLLAMHRALPHSALWVIPQADHIPATNTWRREAFDTEIERFLLRRELP